MRIAVLDLGTNTFHLLIADEINSSWHFIHKERVSVKIGEKGISKGLISEEGIGRALKAIIQFKKVIDDQNVNHIIGTATSAVRNARNRIELN